MNNGLLLVYTGEGKGKTTASLGLALRACGHELSVCILQFMKKGETGEVLFSRKHNEPLVVPMGLGTLVKPNQANTHETINCAITWTLARAIIDSGMFDIIILDEIGVASYLQLIDDSALTKLVEERPDKLTIVITGRNVPEQIMEIADIVSEVKEIKHHFRKGVKPIRGIEY